MMPTKVLVSIVGRCSRWKNYKIYDDQEENYDNYDNYDKNYDDYNANQSFSLISGEVLKVRRKIYNSNDNYDD